MVGWSTLAAVGALVILAPRPAVDNSIHALLDTGAPEARAYQAFLERFGTDDVVLIRAEGPDQTAVLQVARAAQDALLTGDPPAVTQVISPFTAFPDLTTSLLDPEVRDLVDPGAVTRTLSGPLSKDLPLLRLDPSGAAAAAVVLGFGRQAEIEVRRALVARLEALRGEARAKQVTLRMAGPPLLNLALDQAGRDVERTALPLLAVVTVLLLLLTTRSVRVTVALLVPVGLGVAASDALLALAGRSTNVMVNVAKPLLLVLLMAAGVHIAVRFFHHRRHGLGPADAAWAAAHEKARPTTMAMLTTLIGFGSLALSQVSPIRTFGLVTAAGLVLGLPLVLFGLPALLAAVARGAPPPEGHIVDVVAERLVQVGLRNPRVAIAAGLLAIVAGAVAFPTLGTEPHAIRYFSPQHPVRADHDALEAAGLGLSTIELVLTATAPWALTPAAMGPVEALRSAAAEAPGVRAALALPLLLEEASHQIRGQDSLPDAAFAAEVLAARPNEARLLVSDDQRSLRLSLLIETLDASALDALEARLRAAAQADLPKGITVSVTGSYPLLLRAQRSLLDTLKASLITTLLLMEVVLVGFLGGLKVALVALLPNVVPVALNFALMAVLGIPVDLGTSMTAAVALGIAVDDTLHVAVAFGQGPPATLAARCGRAVVLSSVVIGLGFMALTPSSFGPTRSFGLLAGFAMLTALWGDLVMLPPLLRWLARGKA